MRFLKKMGAIFLALVFLLQCINISSMDLFNQNAYAASSNAIKIQLYNLERGESTSSISPRFKGFNTSSEKINLKDIEIRYYFTVDDEQEQTFICDWSSVGASDILGSIVKMPDHLTNADYYLDLGFKDQSGYIEANDSIEIHCRINKNDWSNYTQSNDFTFNSSSSKYIDWDKVTASVNGTLVWGKAADGKIIPEAISAKVQMYNANNSDTTNTISPRFKLINKGTTPINLSDITIRYYYTIDGEKEQKFWCDWSNIGASKIIGNFEKLDSPKSDSDYYFELGFDDTGAIKPGNVVEMQLRIAKSDWSNFKQANDFSFNKTAKKYIDWDKVAVFINDDLVWGMPGHEATGVNLNINRLTLNSGEKQQLIASVTPETAANKNVIWESSDSNVATVDQKGIVSTVAEGEAMIIATTAGGEYTDSCYLQVASPIPAAPALTAVSEGEGISLSWDKERNVDSYIIKRRSDSGEYMQIASGIKESSYIDTDLQGQGTYYYIVNAVNSFGISADSNEDMGLYRIIDDDGDELSNKEEITYGTDPNKIDTDEDGLSDFVEIKTLRTDPLNKDTDSDGLPDNYEYAFLNINPIEPDTNGNGIKDGQEDLDGDGLTNEEEYRLNTDALLKDTDNDELNDKDEVKNYNTDPLNYDSDGDGISDGEEVKLGFDPNNEDSDSNGIIDSDEKIAVTIDASSDPVLSSTNNLAVPEVNVSLKAGAVNSLSMNKDESIKALNESHAIIGYPVDILCDSTDIEATIKFKISDSVITTTTFSALDICWYDKTDNTVKPLETQRDNITKTLSATTNHFSTYFVMDTDKKAQEIGVSGEDIAEQVKGQADITFVVDTTGSMDDDIQGVRNYISKFVNDISNKNIYLRLGIVAYNDYINEPEEQSSINYGWFTDVNKFSNVLNDIDVGDGWSETPVDALEMARRMGFGSSTSKFIVFITDEGYYNNNRYGVTDMASEINLLKNDGITTYVVTTQSLKLGNDSQNGYDQGYENLYKQTGGEYADIYSDYSIILGNISNKITSIVNDGYWILLSDLTLNKLQKNPSLGDTSIDSDGDGLMDIEELTSKTSITIGNKTFSCWNFKSNPTKDDTDSDGLNDYRETIELRTNPSLPDSDFDGLDDKTETEKGTNPLSEDTDSDGYTDRFELDDSTFDPLEPDRLIEGDELEEDLFNRSISSSNLIASTSMNFMSGISLTVASSSGGRIIKGKPITLKKDDTWSGRIHLYTQVTIPKGVTLTVKPGAKVFILNKYYYSLFSLVVSGELKIGDGSKLTTFFSGKEKKTDSDYYGINVLSGGWLSINNTWLDNARRPLCVEGKNATMYADKLHVGMCYYGMWVKSKSDQSNSISGRPAVYIKNSEFVEIANTSILAEGDFGLALENCNFSGSGITAVTVPEATLNLTGVNINGAGTGLAVNYQTNYGTKKISIDGCKFNSNDTGIAISGPSNKAQIKKSEFKNNKNYAIATYKKGIGLIYDCDFENNRIDVFSNATKELIASLTFDFVWGIGDLKGFAEAAVGRDIITGDELNLVNRGLCILCLSELKSANKAGKLIKAFGDVGAEIVTKHGDEGLKLLEKYGTKVVGYYNKYGDKAITIIAKHGDDALELFDKNGVEAVDLIGEYGIVAIKALKSSDTLSDMYKYNNLSEFIKNGTKLNEKLGLKEIVYKNYRTNLETLTGLTTDGKKFNAHHVFPDKFFGSGKKYEKIFTDVGLNINDPRLMVWWQISSHQSKAYEFNNLWDKFLRSRPSIDEVIEFGRSIMKEYEFKVRF